MRSLSALFVLCLVAAAGLAAAPAAEAKTRTIVGHAGPFDLDGFETETPKRWVHPPRIDGWLTGMDAWLVYPSGRRVPISRVMLHHIVFLNRSKIASRSRTTCEGRNLQPFWGTGEERQKLILPRGYGYRLRKDDQWFMQTMLMSHSLRSQRVRVQYRMRVVTGRRLTPVRPLWLRANGCTKHPSYDVDGQGGVHTRSHDWKLPLSGRIVAAGAHLHGSSFGMTVSQPSCKDRTLIRHEPRYAPSSDKVYRLKPVLHEPGPVATGYFLSRRGIDVRRGEVLRVTGKYDADRPHPGVMAITHVYVAPGRKTRNRCAPLPRDRRIHWTRRDGSSTPPKVTVPLHGLDKRGRIVEIDRPPGRERVSGDEATVRVRNGAFQPANLSIALGGKVEWRFEDAVRHNVLLANGPRNVASPTSERGDRYTKRFLAPGEYRLFCYLHPITMTQVVKVRP